MKRLSCFLVICSFICIVGKVGATGYLTYSFDDGEIQTYTNAYPILAAHGQVGTANPILDRTLSGYSWCMTVQQLLELEAAGWEICSHSVTHPSMIYLPLTYADETSGAPNSAERELEMSKIGFIDLGLNVQNFVVPGSAWNDDLATLSASYYNSAASGGKSGNTLPLENRWWIRRRNVATSDSVNDITALIEKEINDNKWLILIFHNICEKEDCGYEPWSETKLDELATWVEDQGISVVTQQQGLELSVVVDSLSYTPVTPCRIVDTRKAVGAIPPGGLRSYIVRGDVVSQGGNSAGCPSPNVEPHAVHLNVAAVPVAGQGHLRMFQFNTPTPNASILSYKTGAETYANAVSVKTCYLCTKDVNVQSFGGTTHVVIDVMGYYFPTP